MYKPINQQTKLPLGIFLLLFLPFSLIAQDEDYIGLFLTWKDDPTSTMVVDWHSFDQANQSLFYRPEGDSDWLEVESEVLAFPHALPERWIHRVALSGLDADSRYYIRIGEQGEDRYFLTMPADISQKAVRIALGGDTMHAQEDMERTNRQVMRYNPDFVVIGGDLAYADGDPTKIGKWYDWFEAYNNTLIAPDGRVVPMVVGIGNHEVQQSSFDNHAGFEATEEHRASIAPFFFGLFAFPGQPGYGLLDFGNYLSLFVLDTDHANAMEGAQLEWLEENLSKRMDVLHRIPIYHIPAFPSVRKYDGHRTTIVRNSFVPLFEKYGVRLAFENHDHAYKRTFPILEGGIDEKGVVYVGDGSWGTSPRKVHDAATTWYLNKAMSVRAFTILSLEGNGYSLIAVDENGRVIDSYPENPFILK
jgi:acid phosphatase type 7